MLKRTITMALAIVGAWFAQTARSADLGVTVNGVDVSALSGDGWSVSQLSDINWVELTGSREFVLSGTNTAGGVCFVVTAKEASLVVSNLTLDVGDNRYAGIALADSACARVTLKGISSICGGKNNPAIKVPEGTTFAIGGEGSLDASPGNVTGGIMVDTIGVAGSSKTGDIFYSGGRYTFYMEDDQLADGCVREKISETEGGYTFTYRVRNNRSTITPQTINHTSVAVFTNGVEVAGQGGSYFVTLGETVTVVYTAETDYVFAYGGTTAEATFTADQEEMAVPYAQLPDEPLHLSGVTVNGLDVSALYGTGWAVDKTSSGDYAVQLYDDSREYVLNGTNTEGHVRIDVKDSVTGASLVVSNLVLSGYAKNEYAGIYLGNKTSVDLTLKGVNAISGGAKRPAIEVQFDATLAIGGDGALAASHGENADYIGRYGVFAAGSVSYSGGRYNFAVPEDQLADGYAREAISETEGGYTFTYRVRYNRSTITAQTIDHASVAVFTNGVEVAGQGGSYVVTLGATVTVVYTAETDYVFAGGGTAYETTFAANEKTISVTAPDEPLHLSGVTVNGLDVSALYGTGWTVIKTSFGDYTVRLNDGSREYVLCGTNTEGYVRFDVNAYVTGASLVVSNLILSGYAQNECAGIYIGDWASVDLTLKGLSAISSGVNRPAIEVPLFSSLAIGGDGSLAASHGEGADYIGRYTGQKVGTIRYSGGRYNFAVPEDQLADGYLRQTIYETEGGYTFTCRVAPKTGVTVNGVDVGAGSGNGWSFADGVLSLTNETAYTLSGTNTAGAVRVEVTTNATVTLRDLTLTSTSESSLIDICASNVTLVITGTNAIHAATDAVVVAADATLTIFGDGWLVGGAADDLTNSFVRVSGALTWKGGVLCDYAAGGIRCDDGGTVRILGGVFGNNGAYPNACEWLGAVGTDIGGVTPVAGSMVTNIMGEADLFAIGQNVASTADGLTGGTFTFNPTNAEYVAVAGLSLADNRGVVEQAGEPVTYQVLPILSTVTPQDVANATYAIFTNGTVEVTNRPCVVAYGTSVKVVYTAAADYVFADGTTTATAEFVADADVVEVPEDQLPDAPILAVVRVTQASGKTVYSASFTNAMNVATNGATVTLLKDVADVIPDRIYMNLSYELDGGGHTLGLKPYGGLLAFAVLSNDVVRMKNVTIDAQNKTGLLAIVASGSLTLTNCCVTGFATRGGALVAARDGAVAVLDTVFRGNNAGAGALAALVSTTNATAAAGYLVENVTMTNNVCGLAILSVNASGEPGRHRFGESTIDNGTDVPALRTAYGVSVLSSGFLGDNTATIGRRSALAFTNAAPESLDLLVPSAVSREGDLLVTNLCGVAIDASKVNVLNNGFTAWGEGGNVYLLSETNFLYATQVKVEGEGEEWKVFRSFAEAYQSHPTPTPSTYTSLSLVHYRNVPNGYDIAVQDDDLAVGAGTNLTLRTVLRECVDGTNTTWNGTTDERVSLTGTLTVAGVAKIENVVLAGKVVLSGGTLDIGAEYPTNGTPVTVEFAVAPESEEVAAITSSVYTGAQLLPHFSLKGDNLVFVVKANGLSVVKVEDKVARVGTDNYDTFSAAVTNVADGGIVEIIASSNATTGAHRDAVKFGGDVRVAAGKSFLVKSIRATLTQDETVEVDENPTEPVTLALDGSKVTLVAGSAMAFTNVAMQGTLELAGSGLLDFASFTGTMLVRPTHTGLIATNVADAAQLRLGTGATGTLYAKGTGIWWRDGSFTARFVQTGNGIGRVDIDDYGVKSSVTVSDPVTTGQYDYHYVGPADQTGTDTNLSFGVVWCEVGTKEASGARITLPSTNLYAVSEWYPQYKTADGDYVDFDLDSDGTWKSLPYLPLSEKDPDTHHSKATLSIRNYGANDIVIATFDIVAYEADVKDGLTEAYEKNKNGSLRDILGLLDDICTDLGKLGVDVLFVAGALAEDLVGYTITSWADAVRGLIAALCHICADVYVDDGGSDSDYYKSAKFNEACERAMEKGWSVHVMRSKSYKACTLNSSWGEELEIDAAACPQTEFSGLASCIIGTLWRGSDLKKAVIGWAAGIGLSFIEGFIEDEIDERVPHGMKSDDDSKAMLTIPAGVKVTLTGMHADGLSGTDLKTPVFDVIGSLRFDQASGISKPHNELSGFKRVSSEYGVVHVRSTGKVYLDDKVTANAEDERNFYVDEGGLVLVEYNGRNSRIGISGQTADGDIFSNTSRWTGGTTNDYAQIFSNDAMPENCTVGIDSAGNIFWVPTVFYLDLNNIPHYATYSAAAYDCGRAYVLRPNKDVEGVIGADAYNARLIVSVINDGMLTTPWTMQVDLIPSVSNEVQKALDLAIPSLLSTVTNDVPTANVATKAGLYYGIPGATEVGDIGTALPSSWTLGTGVIGLEVKGKKPDDATDKAFYRLRVGLLPIVEAK